jgi:alkylated DNA nucleotide flippase Atl1
MSDWFEDVYAAARLIPVGTVLSYGQVGDRAGVTARMAGKAMTFASDAPNLDAVPWWRVLGSDGTLRIGKRDPALARLQRERLEAEGVAFTGSGRVESRFFATD